MHALIDILALVLSDEAVSSRTLTRVSSVEVLAALVGTALRYVAGTFVYVYKVMEGRDL